MCLAAFCFADPLHPRGESAVVVVVDEGKSLSALECHLSYTVVTESAGKDMERHGKPEQHSQRKKEKAAEKINMSKMDRNRKKTPQSFCWRSGTRVDPPW